MDQQTLTKRDALKALAYRRLFEKNRYYVPNGKAKEFIDLIGKGTFISLFSAANGVGKTACGCNIVSNLCFPGYNPWFANLPIFDKFPYLKRGRIVSDATTIKQKIVPELQLWFPTGRYKTYKNSKDYDSVFVTDTGFQFDLMTYDQDPKEFESVDLGWFWCDEPPPELIYKALISRLRRGGIGFITATPLMGSAWMYDSIFTNRKEGQRGVIEATVEDNCKQHGVRGILNHSDIVKMISEYSVEDRQARIFGKFQHLTGLVLKNFNPEIHIIKPFQITEKDFSVIQFYDQHPRNPEAVLWIATRSDGVKFVVNEIYQKFGSIAELATRVKKVDSEYRIIERFADPSAWADVQPTKTIEQGLWKTVGQQLADDHNLIYQPASKQRTHGIALIQDALDYQITEINGAKQFVKKPMLYIFNTCVRTIWEAQHWQYNEWSGKSQEKKDPSEKPQDKDDHMMENLGRGFLNDTGFIPYSPPMTMPIHQVTLDPYDTPQSATLDPYS